MKIRNNFELNEEDQNLWMQLKVCLESNLLLIMTHIHWQEIKPETEYTKHHSGYCHH